MENLDKKIALIATLPKSGTWYSHTFFWCYEQLLNNCDAFLEGSFVPDLEGTLREQKINSETSHKGTLGIDKLYICHSICPGFAELNDARYLQWEALHFPVDGYNWGEANIREWDTLNPANNPDSRIVYLYRNPLDHFISFYRHTRNHIDDAHRNQIHADGTRIPINDIHSFVFMFGGLSAFIKHYYSYKQMRMRYPDQIMMMSYEELTSNPHASFHQILTFMDAAPNTPIKLKLFEEALAMCSKQSLMKLEDKLGHSMCNDQTSGERHIRGGEIGKWRPHFDQHELESIETALKFFNMSLGDFTLVDDESASTTLPWLADFKPQMDHLEFFAAQLESVAINLRLSQKRLDDMRQSRDAYRNSKSWKLTEPLRILNSFAKRIITTTA